MLFLPDKLFVRKKNYYRPSNIKAASVMDDVTVKKTEELGQPELTGELS